MRCNQSPHAPFSGRSAAATLRAIALVLPLLLSLSAAVRAATPAWLVHDDLEPEKVHIQNLADGFVTYFDSRRNLQARSADEFLQVRIDPALAQDPNAARMPEWFEPLGQVVLNDGQRLVGEFVPEMGEADTLRWRSVLLGQSVIDFPLDRLSYFSRSEADRPAVGLAGDRITLANGDFVAGFVEGLSSKGWTIVPEGAADSMTLPHDRVHAVQLANPVRRSVDDGYLVHFRDGTRVLCSDVGLAGEFAGLTVNIGDQSGHMDLPIAWITQIDLPTSAGELQGLSQLAWRTESGGSVFGVPMPPRARGDALHLHAPVAIELPLPLGSRRLAMLARLDADDPEAALWANLVLIVRVDGKEVARAPLSAASPQAQINVPVDGLAVTLEVDPAINGPIMDRLILEHLMLLVQAPKPESRR